MVIGINELKFRIIKLLTEGKSYVKGLSEREKLLLLAAAAIVLLTLTYLLLSFVFGLFMQFSQRFEDLKIANRNMEISTVILRDIIQLKSRQEEIEKRAGAIRTQQSALSYLESSIREKTGLTAPQSFRVTPGQTLAITDDYEQVPYIISFDINQLQPVAALLKEISEGPHAIMVSGMDLRYFQGQDIIKVEIRTTSIRQTGGETADSVE